MRQRYNVGYFSTYEEAHAAKRAELEKSPDAEYQVKRRAKNFELVERLGSRDAAIVRDARTDRTRKKHKRRVKPSERLAY